MMEARTLPTEGRHNSRSALTAIAVSALAALALVASAGLVAPNAAAAPPELFWQTPEDGVAGGEAGRFKFPNGMAADPQSGHLFVADKGNARIVETTAWGEFVKTWGWGVVASGPGNQPAKNERQQLTVDAGAGTYKLTYFNVYGGGLSFQQTTVQISYDWPATDPGTPGVIDSVQEALEDLESLKAAPGSVSVSGGPGSPGGATPYEIEFTGSYADKDVPPLAVSGSTLSGGAAGATVTTLQDGGSFEICIPADGDVCQAGQPGGNKAGEMPALNGGITLDEAGNVYAFETLTESQGEGRSFRVQKFSQAGEFLAMWGGEVNKTKSAEGGSSEAERNLCTKAQLEAGDICGTGVPGSGKGQFGHTFALGNRIALGPEGSIFVGDVERIQRFSAAGIFLDEVEVSGEAIHALAMDGDGHFYATYVSASIINEGNVKSDVRKLESVSGEAVQIDAFPNEEPRTVAVDGSGNVYIVAAPGGQQPTRVIAYEADGTQLIGLDERFAEGGSGLATGEACGIPGADLYVSDAGGFVSAYGPAPTDLEACPPPSEPPGVEQPYASAVGTDSATLRTRINPRFWPDTRYYLQYGTEACESGGCTTSKPTPPGSPLTEQTTKQFLPTEAILLSGLQPGTTYHYRFVAQSSGGGPAFGPEASFTTWPAPTGETDTCPNAALRTGSSAALPDCRAYEMVTPLDKQGGDIVALSRGGLLSNASLTLNQASPDGNRLSYSSYRAFGDAVSAPITSAYIAGRGGGGWSSEGISPSRGRLTWEVARTVDTQFKAFSPDLCNAWLVEETDPPLTADAPAGYANVYRREGCGSDGSYEALIRFAPDSIVPEDFQPELQGTLAGGEAAIFRVNDKLSEDASACATPGVTGTCTFQLYESRPGGVLRAVCVLPGGGSPPAGCSAGSASNGVMNDGRSNSVHNAISADGSRIFWSDDFGQAGRIFLRIEGAITVPVSEEGEALSGLAGKGAQYWTAAADGSEAIFSVGEAAKGKADLYRYRVASGETEQIAGKLYGLLGASEDAQTIYLVSGEALDEGASEGQPNLYRYEAGEGFTFIGELSALDASSQVNYSPVAVVPKEHTAQVSPDGSHVAFMSSAPLTGYDNTDAISGQADAEVYLYDAEEGELRCVSCNPTGARPSGRNVNGNEGSFEFWAAARIPTSQTQLYQTPDVLSEDGNRLYFESFEALEAADTNGKQDVYQWEAAGEGSCKQSSASYNLDAEGCVDLISSGQSKQDASIHAVSASGNDVFIATAAGLVPQDPGLVDIYDARANGGFPAPAAPRPPCEGEACQSPPAPPALLAPSSSAFRGPGNAQPRKRARKRCPRGKRRVRRAGKRRCVAKKLKKRKHSRHRRVIRHRRAAR